MNPITMADLAAQAMRQQLDVTPKPGLVDRRSTGAHTDLDYDMMLRAIEAVRPHLVTFGQTGLFVAEKSDREVADVMQKVGEATLDAMFEATGGVNAYKGTVFCLGLFITAYYCLLRRQKPLTAATVSDQIAALSAHIVRRKDTHGDWVNESYGVEGALGEAQQGYRVWLKDALPMLRQAKREGEEELARFFLFIVSKLKDSCLYYRVGAELAENARTIADYVYHHYDGDNVSAMCSYFERCHLSTGGSGDIFTLLLLADSVLQ